MQLSGRTFSRPFCRFSFSAKSQLPESSFSIDSIKELHGHLIRTQKHKDPDSIFLVLRSYSFNPSTLQKAHIVFDEIQRPTPSIWYYMIRGLSKSDDPIKAINMYNNMRTYGINGYNVTLLFVIKACGRVSDVLQGKKVHVHVLKLGFGSNLYVSNALIYMYGTCREMGVAHKVFDEMSERDLVSWNSLICGYSLSNRYREVLGVFDAMQAAKVRADAVTMVKVIMACSVMQGWSVFLRFTQNNGSIFLQALQQWHSKEKRSVTRKKTLLFKK